VNRTAASNGRIALLLCVALLSASSQPQTATGAAQSVDLPVFHAQTQLVLVDILARDLKTGLPLKDLKRDDFRVFDDKHAVPISTFDSAPHFNLRPIALWFVVICNEKGKGERGEIASGWFSGKEPAFRPALDDLEKNDRAAVAHWCDNGDAHLDLEPTADHDAVIAKLTQTLQQIDYQYTSADDRQGELTLQKLLRLILDQTHRSDPQPLPVLLFLHSDTTGMPRREADVLLDELLETSGFAFGIKDAAAADYPHGRFLDEQSSVLHYMAKQTGGEYYSVPPEKYAETLKSILQQLHARYELGFKPPKIDGKRHKLKVEFTGAAKDLSKSTRLRYRPEYIPAGARP
jgi:hypothetical protein